MQTIEDLIALQQKEIAHFSHQLGDEKDLPDDSRIHHLLEADADDSFITILGDTGDPGPANMLPEVGAKARRNHRIGILFLRQVETEEIGVSGKEKLFFIARAAKTEEKVGAVHLVDLGDESPRDLLFQFLDDSMDDEEVHNQPLPAEPED
jgi:hypothetical protein